MLQKYPFLKELFIHLLTDGDNSIFARLRGAQSHFGGQVRRGYEKRAG